MSINGQDAAGRLLAGAAKTVIDAHFWWFFTARAGEIASARPMGLVGRALDSEDWRLSFVTDGRSRKAEEIRQNRDVCLVFQRETEDAFVKLSGKAALHDDRSEVSQRWKSVYDRYFPTKTDRENATFVDIRVESMDLWIRGLTPEPFGLQATTLERDGGGQWRLAQRGLQPK
jgi:general stress protein 26